MPIIELKLWGKYIIDHQTKMTSKINAKNFWATKMINQQNRLYRTWQYPQLYMMYYN